MKKILYILCIINLQNSFCQQILPIDLLAYPTQNRFSISGTGGANGAEIKGASLSAQAAIDFIILNKVGVTKKQHNKVSTWGGSVKINPFLTTRVLKLDSFSVNKLPFADNEHLFQIGLRHQKIIQNPENISEVSTAPDFYRNFFGDFLITPYSIRVDTALQKFSTINLHLGAQAGVLANWIGPVGIFLSAQTNFLYIFEYVNSTGSIEKITNSTTNINNFYIGAGTKVIVQINDVGIFADARKYFSIGPFSPIEQITKNLVFTLGVSATGTVLRDKNVKISRWD